jgi:hypothetical protein
MAEIAGLSLFNDSALQSYYKFEGNSNDSKGAINGSDTTITYSVLAGKYGQGAQWNGSSSKIDFGNNLNQTTNDFTWVGWVQIPSSGNNASGALISKRVNSGNFNGYEIQMGDAAGNLTVLLNDGSTNILVLACTFAPNNTLQHLAVVIDRGNSICRVYKNGVQINSGAISNAASITNTGTLKFGVNYDSSTFTGGIVNMDDVACFNRVLTPAEVLTLATSGGSYLGKYT